MSTYAENRLLNETLLNYLDTQGMEKRAISAVNDFTRLKVREDGIHRRIMPFLQLNNDEIDRAVDTDKPVKIIDKEPDSPAAVTVPFATLPVNVYIKAPRYRVLFARILSPRFTKDVDELRTYHMDIRQVLSDNAIKDMLAEEDAKFLSAVNVCLVGQDQVSPISGVVQWQSISGGVTRDSMRDAFKILPRTPGHLEVHTVLMNNVTVQEMMKWGRDEMGGDFSQDVMKNGWSEQAFMNARWIITIKRDLVPDDSIFMFAHPKFIGKAFTLEDTTMWMRREGPLLEWYMYQTLGSAIANIFGVGRADFV